MSIPDQVPESSMEEILASIRKIISEDESKGVDAAAAPVSRQSRPSPPSNNVSPLFVDRRSATRVGFERADATSKPAHERRQPADVLGTVPADIPLAEVGEAPPKGEVPPAPEPVAHRQRRDRQLLSPSAETTVSNSLDELKAARAQAEASAVEQLAEKLMRPMVKAWLDDNLPPLVERIVREEIQRISRER